MKRKLLSGALFDDVLRNFRRRVTYILVVGSPDATVRSQADASQPDPSQPDARHFPSASGPSRQPGSHRPMRLPVITIVITVAAFPMLAILTLLTVVKIPGVCDTSPSTWYHCYSFW